ncbi:ABC transporter substrate-binding protein [Rhodococcus sp. WMMA185]|uniref:ABC transporter substrate-binding protein n=1 Tax=Rhodococcus sp. WMMA185 TaxID=679318 RepID=UPI000878E819|nr:sugar ABC transporter substrate-binding protein [Rhodococcus sp. WMMA185]AOW92994.1 ABC transporter substrate-binding protein [Rhodococcus sp. WMMA185]
MRFQKKLSLLAVTAATIPLLAACSQGTGADDQKTVALLLPESKTARYEAKDRPAFTEKFHELCSDCELLYYNADQDPSKQQQQVEAAITQGASTLVLDPVDGKSAAALANRAKQAGVTVISYDRMINDAPIDYYVSTDNEKVGEMQAQALLDALSPNPRPRIVMINGSPQDSNAGDFKTGAHNVFDANDVEIVAEYDTPDWSPDKAQTQMEQAITKVGKDGFDAVYAANDGTAGGAIAALKAAGIDPATKFVTGQDAELSGIQRIVAGEQFMTVYKKITPQAEATAELAAALALGQEPPSGLVNGSVDNGAGSIPTIYTPMVSVTKDAIATEIVGDDWWSASDICTDFYAEACLSAGIG